MPNDAEPNEAQPDAALPNEALPDRAVHVPQRIGRVELFEEIGSGGFATVHLGRLVGAGGFARTVAVKRLRRHLAEDPELVARFLDEARVVARVKHPHVVQTLDLLDEDGELHIVMDYVEGVALSQLFELGDADRPMPCGIALRIMHGVLLGLGAAHTARSETGQPLGLIHRDVSPDNVLVGVDGFARLLDFGVARALGQYHVTRKGQVQGKLAYLAPEQALGEPIDALSLSLNLSLSLFLRL